MMKDSIVSKYRGTFDDYTELRAQENNRFSVSIGKSSGTSQRGSSTGGIFARVYRKGVFGCASEQSFDDADIKRVLETARRNAETVSRYTKHPGAPLPDNEDALCEVHYAPMPLERALLLDMAKALYSYASAKAPELDCTVSIDNSDTQKQLVVHKGVSGFYNIVLGAITVSYTNYEKLDSGMPVSGTKSLAVDRYITEEYGSNQAALYCVADDAFVEYEENLKLCGQERVNAAGGYHECILSPQFNGILAHEAVGHTCEGDQALMAGSVARDHMGQMVASPLVSLTDFARSAYGIHLPINMPFDDEGTPAVDAEIIRDGRLVGYMTNIVSADKLHAARTGNARAAEYMDEPIVRMRNTCFHTGTSKLKDMIASIENGYYFVECGGGNATPKGEFALNVQKGYEIKNGVIGRRIKPTVAAGLAWDALKTVTMVSDGFSGDKHCGMCGKKQSIETYDSGAELKLTLNIGGQ